MRIIAPMMILIMMTSTLAGCTGGDPDGGGNDEIDMDILNQLIDDNLQDFVNNTSVSVTNNYYDSDNSTTTNYVNGTSGNSSALHTMVGIQSGISHIEDVGEGFALRVNSNAFQYYFYPSHGLGYLQGINVCLGVGTIIEGQIQSAFSSVQSSFTSIGVADLSEALDKLNSGECEAIAGERELLENLNANFETWITQNLGYSDIQYALSNSFQLQIPQTNGEAIFVEEIYTSITVTGNCINCSSNQTVIVRTIQITDEAVPEYSFSQGNMGSHPPMYSTSITGFSTCEYGLEQEFSGAGEMFAPGLECTHELNFSINYNYDVLLLNNEGLDPNYDYSWSDWTYYVHWSSSAVEMH